MGRKARGQILRPDGKRKTWALRVPYHGERVYVKLGRSEEGWNEARVEGKLRYVLAAIEQGEWQPPIVKTDPDPAKQAPPTFEEFADEWFERHRNEWRPNTISDYKWALEYHLLPYFARLSLSEITARKVDEYKAAKLAEYDPAKPGERGVINPGQINKTLTRLSQILEEAVEYELIDRNPASGRKRRVKASKPHRTWIEPEQLPTLIESATGTLRPVLATMAGCGLRVGEAVGRDWPDISIPTATIDIGRAKTDAGMRQVDIPIGALEELIEWRQRRPEYAGDGDPAFVTEPRNGRAPARQSRRNVEAQLKPAIKRANVKLAELGIEPISERVTPHSLRRTYASIRAACGDDPVYIAEQLGHTDMALTFRVYQKAVKRRSKLSGAHLREFNRALEWARIGGEMSAEKAHNGHREPLAAADTIENRLIKR